MNAPLSAPLTVDRMFAIEVAQIASHGSIPVHPHQVQLTMSMMANKTATQCFRLDASKGELAAHAPLLRGMRRTYHVLDDGKPVDVTCVLAGGIANGNPVDWQGKPVETIG